MMVGASAIIAVTSLLAKALGRGVHGAPLHPFQVTAGRFRHGTRLMRRRPDKAPRQCTCDQLAPPLTPAQLEQLMKT